MATGGKGADPLTRTVVIAEDEAIVRLDLREILEEQGFEVVGETGRGDEAVELARKHRPDLVILDIKMPGMDGLTAAKEINVDRASAVLILTAFSQHELVAQARDAGAIAYLVKPFQQDELLPAIEVALARFAEMQALEAENAALAYDKRNLEEELETRRWVDRAKGKLMDEQGMREGDAFSFIQQTAMRQRTTMREIAEEIIAGEIVPSLP
ncbi:MAG: response regulator [Acidimicrobiales bacterium]